MSMSKLWRGIALVCALGASAAHAGGPIGICSDKTFVKYPGAGTVSLNYDQGNLGVWTNAQAASALNNARALWNDVNTATITLNRGGDLPVNVTVANFDTYLGQYFDAYNPVIYDEDGSVIDAYLGPNNRFFVLGFAGSANFLAPPCNYIQGQAVINGRDFGQSLDELTNTLAHEIGHLFGMDHTQIDNAQGLPFSNFPLMYPIAFRTTLSLHEDDIAAVSALYPAGNVSSNYGEISGVFTLANGTTAVLGANLWVREVNTGKHYSVVSDYREQGTGHYRLLLPPGTYTMHAEAIRGGFHGGSGVGPYANTLNGLSFFPPMYPNRAATVLDEGDLGAPMAPVTFGGGGGTQFLITAGCQATLNWRINGGGGPVTGNCLPATPTLTVTKAGTGTGLVTSSPAGINCGATCAFDFTLNQMVTLTATPDITSTFGGWTGDCVGATTSCTVTMSAARNVTATFTVRQQFQRVFLSGTGSDANNCVLGSACRTLPVALASVSSGGEIWLMDPVNYNSAPVLIDKSVTILSIPGKLGTLRGVGGDALTITGPGIKVSLQNLNILRETGSGHGVNVTNAASVSIDNCTIYGFSGAGVNVDTGGNDSVVSILNSVVRDNVDGVRAGGNTELTIEGSILGNNTNAGVLVATTTGQPVVNVTESVASGNVKGFMVNGLSAFMARLIVRDSVASGNSTSGFSTEGGANVYMLVSGSMATANGTGFSRTAGTFESRGDNVILGNTVNTSGAITPVGGS